MLQSNPIDDKMRKKYTLFRLNFRYTICVALWLLGVAYNLEINAQTTDNKLFIIDNSRAYLNWAKANRGREMQLLKEIIKPFYTQIYYETPNNFTRQKLYRNPQLFLCAEAAHKLKLVQDSLLKHGLSVLLFDAYRPYRVTQIMWKIVPDENYAANPAYGSGHNRGVAVDLTLADANTGKPLEMPTPFDSFSDTAHHSFNALPDNQLRNRQLLKAVMEHFGFKALSTEWWHYSLPDPKRYPIVNLSFNKLSRLTKRINKNR
jgi:D-alanyl-D-alanine dipeptidase